MMEKRRIFFAGIISAIAGAGLGFVLITLFKPPFRSQPYRNLQTVYLIAGTVGGFLFGASQEALRQLKHQQDEAENAQQIERSRLYRRLESDLTQGDRGQADHK